MEQEKVDILDELKSIETEMLKEFIFVCDKLNLKYYVIAGTLLGTVRHKGFIPWDDDIDVAMPRKDYELFLKEGQKYLSENLFIQCIYTEKSAPFGFTKIRNSNTTFIESSVRKFKINHGVFIDVFPLDYYPENKKEKVKLERKKSLLKQIIGKKYTIRNRTFMQKIKHFIRNVIFSFIPYRKAVDKLHILYKSFPESNLWINHSGIYGEREIMPKDWYGEGEKLMFEGIEVTVPTNYTGWLTRVYGDYMQLPPEEKRIAHHFNEVTDLKKSYKYYTVNCKEGEKL